MYTVAAPKTEDSRKIGIRRGGKEIRHLGLTLRKTPRIQATCVKCESGVCVTYLPLHDENTKQGWEDCSRSCVHACMHIHPAPMLSWKPNFQVCMSEESNVQTLKFHSYEVKGFKGSIFQTLKYQMRCEGSMFNFYVSKFYVSKFYVLSSKGGQFFNLFAVRPLAHRRPLRLQCR